MAQVEVSKEQVQDKSLREFLKYCKEIIGYKKPAKIRLFDDHSVSREIKAMACFFPKTEEIWVLRGQRVRADWYRSLAHELVHQRQREDGIQMDGSDGSEIENEANSVAAVILREFGRRDPEIYDPTQEVNEVLYPNLNIHAVRTMMTNGMLPYDPEDYKTWPQYEKALDWIRNSSVVVKRHIKDGEYKDALYHINQILELGQDVQKGIKEAIEEEKADKNED